MEKYDRDVEQKQHELDVLKVCKLSYDLGLYITLYSF